MLDSHDVGRGRGGVEAALGTLRQPTLVIGISSDVLYPLEMQKELVRQLPNATLRVVLSSEGHDGFLLEHGPIGDLIREALDAPVAPDALVEKHVDDLKMSAATAQRILQNPEAMHAAMMSARAEAAAPTLPTRAPRRGAPSPASPFDERITRRAPFDERITRSRAESLYTPLSSCGQWLCPRCAYLN